MCLCKLLQYKKFQFLTNHPLQHKYSSAAILNFKSLFAICTQVTSKMYPDVFCRDQKNIEAGFYTFYSAETTTHQMQYQTYE